MSDKKKSVLIVEDEPFVVNVYKTKLKKEGYEVHVASNGKEGLEKAKEHMPDIILLDLILPQMNGFDLLEKLKDDEALKDVPVVILSNLGQKSDVEKGMNLGAEDYLVKSDTSLKSVVSKIKEFL